MGPIRRRTIVTVAIVLAILADPAFAGNRPEASQLYGDQRLVSWSRDYREGDENAVLRAVELDLRSPDPHPLAPHVWTTIHSRRQRLAQVWGELDDPRLRAAVEIPTQVVLSREQSRHRQLLEDYPPSALADATDPWTLIDLAASATTLAKRSTALAYLLTAARLHPTHFEVARRIEGVLRTDELRDLAGEAIQPDEVLHGTPMGDYIASFLAIRTWSNLDRLAAADRWLALQPRDAFALKARARVLDVQRHDEEAADAYRLSLEFYPFRGAPIGDRVESLLRVGSEAEARRVADRTALWFGSDPESQEIRARITLARALRETGDRGGVRRLLDATLERWPEDGGLLAERAELERADERYEQAVVYARRAWQTAPADSGRQLGLMRVLQEAGRLEEALEQFEQFDGQAAFRSRDLYARGSQILGALERHRERVDLLERAVGEFPNSAWMHGESALVLTEAGRAAEAWMKLDRALTLNPEYSWGLERAGEYLSAAQGRAAAVEWIRDRMEERPWQRAVWRQYEELTGLTGGEDADARIALWREAVRRNTGADWPVEELRSILVGQERWVEALGAAEALFATEPASQADAIGRYFQRAVTVRLWAQVTGVDSARAERALADLEAFRAGYGWLEAYHRERETILLSLGRDSEAAEAQWARATLYPDDIGILQGLVGRHLKTLGSGMTIGRGRAVVDRNPYDGSKLFEVARLHVLWGGSPIVALGIVEAMKTRGIYSQSYSWLEGRALGNLGDTVAHFEAEYGRRRSISGSQRYVDWYDAVRRDVLTKERRHVRIDHSTGVPRAEITLPNKEILIREDHPISGKLMSLSKGPAFVRAVYEETGDRLQEIRASSGAKFFLRYDESGRIIALESGDGGAFSFVYNERGKQIEIRGAGVGTLRTAYDENGRITSVDVSGESRESNIRLAAVLSRSMQEMLDLVGLFEAARHEWPSLPYRDDRRDRLRARYRELVGEGDGAVRVEAGLVLARYLVKRLHEDAAYGDEAREVLEEAFDTTASSRREPMSLVAGEAVTLWHRLARATKTRGLPAAEYARWATMHEWLRARSAAEGGSAFKGWLSEVDEVPLELFADELWLPRSDLRNTGFWTRYANGALFPAGSREVRAQAAIVRRNGDVVVGHSAGISVMRRDYWEWFGFDDGRGRFSATMDGGAVGGRSEVLALAETDDDTLWVGTARGLHAVGGEYDGALKSWTGEEDGLPSARIEHLVSLGEGVVFGTNAGLRSATSEGIRASVPAFADARVRSLGLGSGGLSLLVGTEGGLSALMANGEVAQLTPWPVDDALWAPFLEQAIVLRGEELYGIDRSAGGGWLPPAPLLGQQEVRYSRQIYGLAMLQVPQGEDERQEAVAVLTDEGMAMYRDRHFEFMSLPLGEQRLGLAVGPHAVATKGADAYLVTNEGLYAFRRGRVKWDTDTRVHDLLADHASGRVYVARGYGIDVIDESDEDLRSYRVGWHDAQYLALDGEGRLLANDGHDIVRFDGKEGLRVQELFQAVPTEVEGGLGRGPVRDLLVAADGAVWVAAGGSVFRWQEDAAEEFSFFVDAERFPSRTQMITGLVETIHGDIWVIGSNEGHLNYRGTVLRGGLLEWTGDAFSRIETPESYRMITGYTQIADDTAIAGSTAGFFRHTADGSYDSFRALGDATYRDLEARTPILWLGRDGAKLEEGSWLFPSAGGVILYHRGRWFYPDRLNQVLPDDQRLGQYGGRTAHAVAVDGRGRVYAGTDRGLAIYDAGGSAAAVLVDNGLAVEAFADSAVERLAKVGEVILEGIEADSEAGAVLSRYREAERDVRDLEMAVEEGGGPRLGGNTRRHGPEGEQDAERAQARTADGGRLRRELATRERQLQRLLYQLENEHYGLFQMLRLDPRELSALHMELAPGQAVVQYLPTPSKLFIQLVTREGTEYREVGVSDEELYGRALRAAEGLRGEVERVDGNIADVPLAGWLVEELAWLYDQLLRPVERELAGMSQVFVVPVGSLTYLPFAALVYDADGDVGYAVERFAMGALPSLFHLQLVLKHRASYVDDSLLMGDPDGSLPAARREVREIGGKLPGARELVGDDATLENFEEQAPYSRIVHLATHGALDQRRPEDSYLLMADGYRLSVVDISLLELDDTDLVVLSACESGVGLDGLEYATLARAFAHARVPTVIASLGKVSDGATRALMAEFYDVYVGGADAFVAMAAAQRRMIASGTWAHPGAWSGFLVFGRP